MVLNGRRRYQVGKMMTALIQISVTCFFFFLEALLHYNIGKSGQVTLSEWPPPHDLMLLSVSIVICSLLSTFSSNVIGSYLGEEKTKKD